MPEKPPRRSTARVSTAARTGSRARRSKLIEWPENEAEAAAILAAARQVGDQLDALLPTVHDMGQWQGDTVACLRAVIDYQDEHPDAVRNVGGRLVYSQDFSYFILWLVSPGQPGEYMSMPELAYATCVPEEVLREWLDIDPSVE